MTNTPFDREVMLKRMQNVIRHELTEWQQTVIEAIYYGGKTQAQLAAQYGVNRSSVCRALHRAEAQIRRFLSY